MSVLRVSEGEQEGCNEFFEVIVQQFCPDPRGQDNTSPLLWQAAVPSGRVTSLDGSNSEVSCFSPSTRMVAVRDERDRFPCRSAGRKAERGMVGNHRFDFKVERQTERAIASSVNNNPDIERDDPGSLPKMIRNRWTIYTAERGVSRRIEFGVDDIRTIQAPNTS